MAKKKCDRTKKDPHAKRTVWSQEEEAVLCKHCEDWLELESREERDEFCSRVREEIRVLTPEKYGIVVVTRNRQLKAEWERRFRVHL